jgi:hypothetical protein
MWNFVSHIRERTYTEGIWKPGAKENIWTEQEWNNKWLQKTAQLRAQ